jgi:uncharacterized membrane protein YadS
MHQQRYICHVSHLMAVDAQQHNVVAAVALQVCGEAAPAAAAAAAKTRGYADQGARYSMGSAACMQAVRHLKYTVLRRIYRLPITVRQVAALQTS